MKSKSPGKSAPLSGLFYYMMFAVASFSIGNSSDMFLVLRAQNIGIGAAFAPLLGLVFNTTYTAFSWPAGKLSDRMSKKGLVAAGYSFLRSSTSCLRKRRRSLLCGRRSLSMASLRAYAASAESDGIQAAPPESRGRAFGIFYFVTSVTLFLPR